MVESSAGWDSQSQVFALTALLDEDHTARVHQIWNLLEIECGLKAVHVPPYPHFSFHVAQKYRLSELDSSMSELTREIAPFLIRTTGLSLFTGKNPVAYIPVVASKSLLEVHHRLWEKTTGFGTHLNMLYQPGHWVPHITLVHDALNADRLNCIFDQLIERTLVWEIEITNLGIIYQKDGGFGIHKIYPLGSN